MGLSKAFDILHLSLLIAKLEAYGFDSLRCASNVGGGGGLGCLGSPDPCSFSIHTKLCPQILKPI